MYHTPQLRGVAKRVLPARFNEVVGVQHIKVYAFDDHLILSGYEEMVILNIQQQTAIDSDIPYCSSCVKW